MSNDYAHAQLELLDKVKIVDLISGYMTLHKKGSNYNGLCPFHNEKTPSFMVSPAKGIYKCFGCGKGGNLISFYMEHEHLSWVDTIRELAKKYDVNVGQYDAAAEKLLEHRRNMLVVASNFYHKNVGKIRSNIHERGITDESIEQFHLGFSDGSNSLSHYLYSQGFTIDDMLSQGLIHPIYDATGSKDPSKYFEKFQNRWIFPLYNDRGKIVGFAGRVLPSCTDKRVAKYINSPESELYHKSSILYGLNRIQDMIRKDKQAYLVEGYTDTIMMHQQGLPAVSSSGTAFTEKQAKLLAKYVDSILLVGDNDVKEGSLDNAGVKAVKNNFHMMLAQGVSTSALLLPPGDDPASFFEKYSLAEFNELEKMNLAKFYVITSKILNSSTVDATEKVNEKVEILEDIITELSYIPDPVAKFLWVSETSKLLGIPEVLVAQKYTEGINAEIKSNNAVDYFSERFMNSLAYEFVAKILLMKPKFALPYLRDVPLADMRNDGSIFSKKLFEFYTNLSKQFSAGDYALSLTGIDTDAILNAKLMDEDRQINLKLKTCDYLIHYPGLFDAVCRQSRKLKRQKTTELNRGSNGNGFINPDTSIGNYTLETLTKLLRSEIFIQKQSRLNTEISEALMSGSGVSDISGLVEQIEDLHHSL